MRWYEYRMQVDELHAPAELKAQLLAMQPAAAAAKAPAAQKNVKFPLKRVLGVAACFAVGFLCCGALGFGSQLTGLGSARSAASTATYSLASVAENSMDMETYALADTADGSGSTDTVLSSSEAEAQQADGETQSAKIIYTANLTLESKDYDSARAALEQALSDAGGYMEDSSEYNYTGSTRSLSLTLRVPEQNYESFLAAVAEIGNVTYQSQQADDVTAQYMDIETRLENLQAQRTRLQELQAQAETLADLLEIEQSLTDVQSQIESWQSQLDWYSNQVSCCTVYISLEEVQAYTPDTQDFGARFAAALSEGWANFVAGLQSVAVSLAAAWPAVVIVVILAAVLVILRRKKIK